MSQKVLFYQEDRPKTADGLWMHKDSDGNMKLDYVGNNSVYPVGYISSEAGGSSVSDGYKAYIEINPSSEVQDSESEDGVTFTNAQDAAQALGISEQDFLKFFSDQMPMAIGIMSGFEGILLSLERHGSNNTEGYIRGGSSYVGSTSNGNKTYTITILARQNDDDEQEYNIFMSVLNVTPIG